MSKSVDNLKTAFAGESMANRRYLAFAKKADDAGFPQIARLFRAAAAAETVHATNHLRAMDGIKDSAANLQVAIEGEHYEVVTMYPDMLAEAQPEGDKTRLSVLQLCMADREDPRSALSRGRRDARKRQRPARGRVLHMPGLRSYPSRQVGGRRPVPGLQYTL